MPWCTYPDLEIAHVGLYVREARVHPDARRGSRARRRRGLREDSVKERADRILGATIVARHVGEMIDEITLARVAGIVLRTLARVIHTYPTQAEATRKTADAYKRTRLTPTV
jgi:pyruvate/2-oxoglutarate dehydrogenase complex dihydrolipoamide dehydrogenase (E3) component